MNQKLNDETMKELTGETDEEYNNRLSLPINKIICSEAVDKLKEFPDNSIDLTITSPPYDSVRDYEGYYFNFEKIAKQLFRVTKEGGIIVWIVGDQTKEGNESGTSFRQALFFKEIGLNLHDTMIYKQNRVTFPHNNLYHQCFEYMFILVKGKIKTANLIHDRKNKNYGKSYGNTHREPNGKLITKRTNPIKENGARWNIWEYNTGKSKSTKDDFAFKHPAIFPEQLAEDHIKSWSNEGEIILDPMCGSGTTCKMALLNNRKFIGIEVSKEYCNISNQRIKPHLAQTKLNLKSSHKIKMAKRTEDKSFQNLEMSVKYHRDRIGCDICKKNCPTECYIGFCGNVLWVCGMCFREITENKIETVEVQER